MALFIGVDEPVGGAAVTTSGFVVRGWLWLDAAHDRIAAVEVYAGETLAGETVNLYARADVSATLGLPPKTAIAFHITTRSPEMAALPSFDIHVRARFRDGTRTGILASVQLTAAPAERDPLGTLWSHVAAGGRGLEIGAHAQPVPRLTPFYTDVVANFAGSAGRADFLADALALPLPGAALDYLCSSHVLEHLPDPIRALHEWHRVLRPGGWLYLIVPDKRFTFDAPRPVTPAAHLLDDFLAGMTVAESAAHIDEFVYQTDWGKLHPEWPAHEQADRQADVARYYRECVREEKPIDIHFHTFTPASLREMLEIGGFIAGRRPLFELVAQAEQFPPERGDGIGFLLRRRQDRKPPKAIATFQLAHRDPAAPPLPLVCPETLDPLREGKNTAGERMLVTRDGRRWYAWNGDCPVMLPPAAVSPRRPWRNRTWRVLRHLVLKYGARPHTDRR